MSGLTSSAKILTPASFGKKRRGKGGQSSCVPEEGLHLHDKAITEKKRLLILADTADKSTLVLGLPVVGTEIKMDIPSLVAVLLICAGRPIVV